MASLFGSWGSDPFGELVEKATSELLPAGQEDIALNLEICDQVRAKQVPAKQAMQTLKRRVSHKNPNVVLLALGLTDICIKNGGDHFLAEVASREFMDNLASVLRNPAGVNFDVKSKALRLIQNWSQIAQTKPHQMGYITETYKSLKLSGYDFPSPDPTDSISAALVETLTAPEWTDSDVCMRCRTAFTTFNRRHHCRNCGNVFCQDCSSRSMALPWFGVGQDVRVCDGCFAKKAPPAASSSVGGKDLARSKSYVVPTGRGGLGSHHRSNTTGSNTLRSGSSRKKEEDDLALAIRLSLEASGSSAPALPSQPSVREGRPTRQADGRMLEGTDADDDPDLAAAIAASLRDYAPPQPSAPDDEGRETPRFRGEDVRYGPAESRLPLPPSLELPASDVDSILTFSQAARAQEMLARQHGRWQTSGPQQQQLEMEYERATAARPRVAKSLDEATRRHGVLISMHDKLSEAVRLYDRLLDAQMSRPTYASTGYGQPASRGATNGETYRHYVEPQVYGSAIPLSGPPSHYGPQSNMMYPAYYATQAQGQDVGSSDMYPGLPAQVRENIASGAGSTYGANVSHDTNSTQSTSQSYALPESPSPFPGYQQYFDKQQQQRQQYAQASAPVYPSASHQFDRQQQSSSVVSPMENIPSDFAPHLSADNRHPSVMIASDGSRWQGQDERLSLSGGLESEPMNRAPNNIRPAIYDSAQPLSSHPASSHTQNFNPAPEENPARSYADQYNASLHKQVGADAPTARLSETMASLTMNSPSNAISVGQASYITSPSAERRDPTLPQQQQTYPSQHDGWQAVPITHTNASVIASAPPVPQSAPRGETHAAIDHAESNGMPSLPSAPLTSPNTKRSSEQNVPITYEAAGYPTSPTTVQQPWIRPVETPLIDL